ncbi:MAG: alpha-amylase family glycosyl hydrolase [Xylanivirga thermophila]|jgi:glycosidase|uniref:alpha-amylase family glycosyl hydrolase n=1 Tax=Xylanivirga thermophila TaxID=2496273 RepID=UPI0039F5E5C9
MKRMIFIWFMIVILVINLVSCQPSQKSNTLSKGESTQNKNVIKEDKSEKEKVPQTDKNSNNVKQKVSKVNIPEWSKNAVIYEVNVRQYTKEGTFKAFEAHLPRLKEMGVDILWFMPIYPISEKNRKGTLGSYYAVKDYTDVNPEFGTMEDFKELVDKCHDMGFKVLLDWVANHTGWDNVWIENNPDWYTQNADGNIIHPLGTDWTDVADLNYNNQDMRKAMLDAMKFWVKEIGVDGFRADYANGVPKDFWETVRGELDTIKPVYMLAEDDRMFTLLNQAFNVNYGWELHHIMNKVAKGQNNAKYIETNLKRTQALYPKGTYPMNFTSNHDENSWSGTEYERLGDAVKAMAVLTFVVPGIPLIYSGQEAGLDKRLEFFEKDEIDWGNLTMQDFYKNLITLKKENPALWNGKDGGNIHIIESTDKNILAFVREKDKNKVVAIFNLSSNAVTADINFEDYAGAYLSFFLDEPFDLAKDQTLNLKSWEYIILTSK